MSASKAKAVGRTYANDQVESDLFRDWVLGQLIEGKKLSREGQAAPGLETENLVKLPNARRLAAVMLQQLGWDIDRGLDARDVRDLLTAAGVSNPSSRGAMQEFAEGLKGGLKAAPVKSWLAQKIQTWAEEQGASTHGDMKLGISGRRSRSGSKRSSRGSRRPGRRSSRR